MAAVDAINESAIASVQAAKQVFSALIACISITIINRRDFT